MRAGGEDAFPGVTLPLIDGSFRVRFRCGRTNPCENDDDLKELKPYEPGAPKCFLYTHGCNVQCVAKEQAEHAPQPQQAKQAHGLAYVESKARLRGWHG